KNTRDRYLCYVPIIKKMVFSSDSKQLLICDESKLELWNVKTGKSIKTFPSPLECTDELHAMFCDNLKITLIVSKPMPTMEYKMVVIDIETGNIINLSYLDLHEEPKKPSYI